MLAGNGVQIATDGCHVAFALRYLRRERCQRVQLASYVAAGRVEQALGLAYLPLQEAPLVFQFLYEGIGGCLPPHEEQARKKSQEEEESFHRLESISSSSSTEAAL